VEVEAAVEEAVAAGVVVEVLEVEERNPAKVPGSEP
jgi:hypothetical protein